MTGPLSVLLRITGITCDSVFSPPGYAYRFDLTSWGWIHLVIGVPLFVVGVGILLDKGWARANSASAPQAYLRSSGQIAPQGRRGSVQT
ncbi:DUF7144 family membrane protein [Streptomyces yunnanensis]|uniref:DUF7144 family membrane protein n=1 Tax=Streptomyces yunnanensis TaxID=156453 RepID=UPI003B82EFC5